MKRLSIFLLMVTIVAFSSSGVLAAMSEWPQQGFKVPGQMPAQQRGKILAPQLVQAGDTAVKVLAEFFKQIVGVKQLITKKNYQAANDLFTPIFGMYKLIVADPNGQFLLQRLKIETGSLNLNNEFFNGYTQAIAKLKK